MKVRFILFSVLRISEILYSGFSTVVAWSTESVEIVRNKCEKSHRVDMKYQIYLFTSG